MSLEIDQLFLFLGNAGWTGGGFSSNFKDNVLVSNSIHVYLMLIANLIDPVHFQDLRPCSLKVRQ